MSRDKLEVRIMGVLGVLALGATLLAAASRPGLMRFWPFTVEEFVAAFTPLFLVALFIERALEVFMTAWRSMESSKLQLQLGVAKRSAGHDMLPSQVAKLEEDVAAYKAMTCRIAFLAGSTIGILLAALGMRVLEVFVDPAVFAELPDVQQRLFVAADILLTGVVLGGGADAMHKFVTVFTSFMENITKRINKKGDAA